jgi:hypothetical protein
MHLHLTPGVTCTKNLTHKLVNLSSSDGVWKRVKVLVFVSR